jgi:F-type H+-transporting ATPase subunit b
VKRLHIIWAAVLLAIAVTISLPLFPHEALAADSSNQWRPAYDLIMRYLNFGILLFLLIKFGKKPLVNFLRQRKEELQKEINRAEEKKKEAEANVAKVHRQLDESAARLEEIKQKIIKQGEIKKQRIIENAQQESKILLQEAKRRIDSQVLNARKRLQAQMIDEAMAIVFKKLPRQITEEDNQKFLDQYLTRVLSE